MTAIAFAIVVTDGVTLRTIHPASLGPQAQDIERILRGHLFGEPQPATRHAETGALTRREIAATQGFTGDACPSVRQLHDEARRHLPDLSGLRQYDGVRLMRRAMITPNPSAEGSEP
jgi:hypothetical protein